MALKNIGAAEVIEEKNLTGEGLIRTVNELISDRTSLDKMGKKANSIAITDSCERIYSEIMKLHKA